MATAQGSFIDSCFAQRLVGWCRIWPLPQTSKAVYEMRRVEIAGHRFIDCISLTGWNHDYQHDVLRALKHPSDAIPATVHRAIPAA